MRIAAGAALLLAAAALGACGTPSPDLFVVNRSGTVPGAKLHMLVSDESVRCNGAPAQELTSAQTLEGRDILRLLLLSQAAKTSLPPSPRAQIFSYSVRDEDGTLSYPDTQQRPAVIPRLTLFVRQLAIGTCHLQR
ncbi:MAG TPA: hypothetical protein VHZ75_05125 [Solirubrobacteraceae bacterium]|nr:hypothetical protein [Solirubrobacteraceae bacterium]